MKLLLARRAPDVLRAMSHAGVIEVILGIGYPSRLQRLADREAAGQAGRGVAAPPSVLTPKTPAAARALRLS
jgi:hypothetical protein